MSNFRSSSSLTPNSSLKKNYVVKSSLAVILLGSIIYVSNLDVTPNRFEVQGSVQKIEHKHKQKLQDAETEIERLKEKVAFLEMYRPEKGIRIHKVTRGLRNKNPMNVHYRGKHDPWLGQIGKDKAGHAVFETYEHGLRAGYLTLRTFVTKHKVSTLLQLTQKYCEGDAVAYAKFIARRLGVKHNVKVNILAHLPEIMEAIIIMENGYNPFPRTFFIAYKR